MSRQGVAACVVLLGLPVAGQDVPPPEVDLSVLTRGPVWSVSFVGPDAVRQAVLPTNLGGLFSAKENQFVGALVSQAIGGMFQSGQAARAWRDLQQQLLGYSGRVDFEMHADPDAGRDFYAPSGHLVLAPDGTTDLAVVGAQLRRLLLEATGVEPQELEIAGRRFDALAGNAQDAITLPAIVGERLVLFYGEPIEKSVTRGLARLDEPGPDLSGGDLVAVAFDLAQFAAIYTADSIDSPADLALGREFMGMDAWDRLRFSLRTAGPHLQVEGVVEFLPGNRGIFGAFMPSITSLQGLASLVPLQPESQPAFLAAHVDGDALYEAMIGFVANFTLFGGGPKGREAAEAEVRENLGFDFKEDLLAHLDSGVLVLQHLSLPAEGERSVYPDGLCVVVRVEDEAAFTVAYEKIIAQTGSGAVVRIGSVEATPVRMFDRGEYLARSKGFAFFAVGKRGLAAAAEFVGRQSNPVDLDPSVLPVDLVRTQSQRPQGFNAAGVISTAFLRTSLGAELVREMYLEVRRELGIDLSPDELQEGTAAVVARLRQHGLDRVVVLGGYEAKGEAGTARVRLIW